MQLAISRAVVQTQTAVNTGQNVIEVGSSKQLLDSLTGIAQRLLKGRGGHEAFMACGS